jgi:hypothetical protein
MLNSAPAGQELKVDLAHIGDSSTQKPGWIIWAEHNNEQYHDMYRYDNLGGTGIDVRMSVGSEGKGALGKSADGAEPICNTFYFHFDMGEGPPIGDVLLGFYNIPAGVYSLKSYHRHPAGFSPMPRIDVNCVNLGGKWSGDANCSGVTQIHDEETNDVNVGIPGDQIYDDNLPYSLVKFQTDGSDVLVRYWSQGQSGVLNAFILESLSTPDTAWSPSPEHPSEFVCPDANLSWQAGKDANSHNVYLGTSWDEVNDANSSIHPNVDYYNVSETNCDPGPLAVDQTYYWRVDEVNTANPNSPWKGFLWNFTTEDGKARNPSPAISLGSIATSGTTLSWTPSCLADQHDIYLSSKFEEVNESNSVALLGTTYGSDTDIPTGSLEFAKRYYWKVKETGSISLPEPDIWYFQTVGYPLMHYKFDGVMDSNIPLPITDSTGNVTFDRGGGYGSGPVGAGQLKYGEPNPIVNPDATCAHFMPQTGAPNIPGGAVYLRRKVAGSDILDLDGPAYTIEMWVRQDGPARLVDDDDYAATLFRKYESSYVVAIGEDGAVRFVHGGYGGNGRRLESAPDVIELDEWYHIAAVFDQNDPNQAQKLYVGGLLVDDGNSTVPNPSTDDDPTTIGGRIPPLSENQYLKNVLDGAIDELRVSDLALDPSEFLLQGDPNLAWLPRPSNRAKGVQYDVDLEWLPGQYASSHDVYFGTNWDEVNDANSSIHPNVDYNNVDVNMEDIPYLLDLEKTYYWRVDEVNDTSTEKWKGRIWRFTVAEYILIDDMEEYTPGWPPGSTNPITYWSGSYGWDCGFSPPYTGSVLSLADAAPYPLRDDQTMICSYDNGPGYYYSEIATHDALKYTDWDTPGVRLISLWFHGDQTNSEPNENVQMYVGLEDSGNTYAEVRYPLEDMGDILVEEWQQWVISLSDFTNVDLVNVQTLYIGFGDRTNSSVSGGLGTVYVDDIRLYPPTCILSERPPAFAALDWDDDCIIGWGEIEIMAEEWLKSDVNLGQVSEPCDANLVGWWKFDEGSGSTASDSSIYTNNGTLEILDVNVSWVVGHDGNALEFDGGRVRVPDAAELRPMEQVSVSAWIKYSDEQEDGRVVVKGGDEDETYQLEVDDDDDLKFHIRDGNDYDPCDNEYRGYMAESDNDAIDRDEWTHVAGTFDANTLKCYVNGELAGENNDPNIGAILFLLQDTNDLGIGMRPDDEDNEFEGMIDDVRIYDYGLPQAEVAWLATGGTGILEVQSIANLINDEPAGKRAVNLRDLAILADDWLVQELYP